MYLVKSGTTLKILDTSNAEYFCGVYSLNCNSSVLTGISMGKRKELESKIQMLADERAAGNKKTYTEKYTVFQEALLLTFTNIIHTSYVSRCLLGASEIV